LVKFLGNWDVQTYGPTDNPYPAGWLDRGEVGTNTGARSGGSARDARQDRLRRLQSREAPQRTAPVSAWAQGTSAIYWRITPLL